MRRRQAVFIPSGSAEKLEGADPDCEKDQPVHVESHCSVSTEHQLPVDSTLRADASKANSLSVFSSCMLSTLKKWNRHALDAFRGTCWMPLSSPKTGLRKASSLHEPFEVKPDLHYLNLVKHNLKLISWHHIPDLYRDLKNPVCLKGSKNISKSTDDTPATEQS